MWLERHLTDSRTGGRGALAALAADGGGEGCGWAAAAAAGCSAVEYWLPLCLGAAHLCPCGQLQAGESALLVRRGRTRRWPGKVRGWCASLAAPQLWSCWRGVRGTASRLSDTT